MDVRDTTIDAVIIKSRTYKEQDKLLTYFSLEQGKGLAIARGACKVSSGLGSIAQSFCRAHLTLTPPRNGVSYISQAMPETSFITLDAGLTAMAYASYILSCIFWMNWDCCQHWMAAASVIAVCLGACFIFRQSRDVCFASPVAGKTRRP